MGVHGLTTYILGNSKLYLKPHELSDCYLVLDGTNLACALSKGLKSHSAFGGDYDEYYTTVRNFMLALKKCNVSPIVLFDGGCEKTKLKTRLQRREAIIMKLKSFSLGFSQESCFPLFIIEVFQDVVREMGFICIQCNLESDGEIAAVARHLNCPVLSYDSDYFIYDVLYIPFNTLKLSPTKYSNSGKYYLECLIYNVNEFLETVGIDKQLLPILATLLGNDYVENRIFYKFFYHVRIPQGKNKSHGQNRLYGLIQWLKNENLASAKKLILSHLENKNADKVLNLFNRTINDYKTSIISEAVFDTLAHKFGEMSLTKSEFSLDWPAEIGELFGQACIPGFIANIILYQFYLTPVQVENVYDKSSHFKSLYLIKKIYAILTPYLKDKKPLTVYLAVKKQYTGIKICADPSDYVDLSAVIKEPKETRLKLLCDIVGVSKENLDFVPSNSWAIFIMGFLYWVKEFKNLISITHIHAFAIMAIANQIIQTKVGYYRNSPDFMKHYGDKLTKLKDAVITIEHSDNFEDMISNVKEYEYLVAQKGLIPLRRTTEAGSGKEYCISTVHLFSCFQSSLYYIMVINALLNYPLPHIRVSDFYSGTLLFNLYLSIKSKPSIDKFGSGLFLGTPNLYQIYNYLTEHLSKFIEYTEIKGRKSRKKRGTKNKSREVNNLERIVYAADDDDEFIDENNPYALLNKIKSD